MMEYEFRGMEIKTGQFVYGSLLDFSKLNYCPQYEIYTSDENTKKQRYYKVYNIGQYIGIKDINQKKVFKSDIVKVKNIIYEDCRRKKVARVDEYIGEVVWKQFGWHIAEKIENGIRYHSLWLWNVKDDEEEPDSDFMEVIGNKWNNPEMTVVE